MQPKREQQAEAVGFYMIINSVYTGMGDQEKEELRQWEKANLDGRSAKTSDWPGWDRYIERRPEPPASPLRPQKDRIPEALRWQVWERDDFTCQWCGVRRNLTIDHIYPESKGGLTVEGNLQTLCKPCNSRKGVLVIL